MTKGRESLRVAIYPDEAISRSSWALPGQLKLHNAASNQHHKLTLFLSLNDVLVSYATINNTVGVLINLGVMQHWLQQGIGSAD
jgi:hypothetical protein